MLLCFVVMATDCDLCLRSRFSILTISSVFFDKVTGTVSLQGAGVCHHLVTHLPAYVRRSCFLVPHRAAKMDVQLPVMAMVVGAGGSEPSAGRSCYVVAQGRCLRWQCKAVRPLGMGEALGWEATMESPWWERCWAGSRGASGSPSAELGSPVLCI